MYNGPKFKVKVRKLEIFVRIFCGHLISDVTFSTGNSFMHVLTVKCCFSGGGGGGCQLHISVYTIVCYAVCIT